MTNTIKKPNIQQRNGLPLQGDWIHFNHENPELDPGLYWAVGMRPVIHPDQEQGLSVFQIIIEVFNASEEIRLLPAATVPFHLFAECLPHIELVQKLSYPHNPYTQITTEQEFA